MKIKYLKEFIIIMVVFWMGVDVMRYYTDYFYERIPYIDDVVLLLFLLFLIWYYWVSSQYYMTIDKLKDAYAKTLEYNVIYRKDDKSAVHIYVKYITDWSWKTLYYPLTINQNCSNKIWSMFMRKMTTSEILLGFMQRKLDDEKHRLAMQDDKYEKEQNTIMLIIGSCLLLACYFLIKYNVYAPIQ